MVAETIDQVQKLLGRGFLLAAMVPAAVFWTAVAVASVGFHAALTSLNGWAAAGVGPLTSHLAIGLVAIYLTAYVVYGLRLFLLTAYEGSWTSRPIGWLRIRRATRFAAVQGALARTLQEKTSQLNVLRWIDNGFGPAEVDRVLMPGKIRRPMKRVTRRWARVRANVGRQLLGGLQYPVLSGRQTSRLWKALNELHRLRASQVGLSGHEVALISALVDRVKGEHSQPSLKQAVGIALSVVAARIERDRDLATERRAKRFPNDERRIRPTRLGNAAAAFDGYCASRYAIEAGDLWPRLEQVLPAEARLPLEDAELFRGFSLAMSALSVPVTVLCAALVLPSVAIRGIDWVERLAGSTGGTAGALTSIRHAASVAAEHFRPADAGPHLQLQRATEMAFAVIGFFLFKHAAVLGTRALGNRMRAAVDLHRLRVFEALGLEKPTGYAVERQMWGRLSDFFSRGDVPCDPVRFQGQATEPCPPAQSNSDRGPNMAFVQDTLGAARPGNIRGVVLPRRMSSFPSPADWRDEVIYFLLPDRFSDGKEATRPMLDLANRTAARPAGFGFDKWAESGGSRYQGGTIRGITSQLDYVKNLGATTLWVGPVFKQRAQWDTYHGYAIQDFLEVDPRFGTRGDLVDLVAAAHVKGMRVLLDIVFNHTGNNWVYAGHPTDEPPYLPWPSFYRKGSWRAGDESLVNQIAGNDDGVWPGELQADDHYTRAGNGNLSTGDIDDPHCEFRRTDFVGDRDINYDGSAALDDLSRCYKYWIALTDCDGFRIDTLKHVDQETGRNFCGTIKEYAANLGKADFLLVGEVAGADSDADRYLQVLGSNLDATLDIGEICPMLTAVAKGLASPDSYFDIVKAWDDDLGSSRNAGKRRVSILDDHDHVDGAKVRFSSDAVPADHQVVAGVAIQLFGMGIPCIYYGTEQAFAGPEKSARDQYLPDYNVGNPPPDKYLREAMFGPEHPRLSGRAGVGGAPANFDAALPGFGPFGTSGAHCFNPASPAYVRIAALITVRRAFPALRYGRQYQRPISTLSGPFALPPSGTLIAWSRVLDDEEVLCVVNGNGTAPSSGDVLVDPALSAASADGQPWGANSPFFQVVANSAQAAAGAAYGGVHPVGQKLDVQVRDGVAFLTVGDLPAAEVIVLSNRP